MARILGLDLGSWSLKGLWVDTAQKGAAGRFWVEVRRRPAEDTTAELRASLAELVGQLPAGGLDQVVVSLPGQSVATHLLSLPFTDVKRIEATLPFEIEGQLPVDLDEVLYDYQQVGVPQERKSELLVGVVRKTELLTLLDVLRDAKLDPRVITHPAVAYQNVLSLQPPLDVVKPSEAVAIVDLGHERTSVAIGTPGGALESARTFSGGGRDLTRLLAQEFQIGPEDAAHWKEQHGAFGSHASGQDGQRASAALARGLQPLLRELRPTLKAHAARTHKQVVRVYLCGATAQIPGIDEQLTHDLGMPVQRLPIAPDVAQASGLTAAHAPAAALAWALALRAQVPASRAPRFNLRRGDLAFKGDFDFLKDRLGLLASFAATLLVLFIASGMVRNAVLKRQEAQVDASLCEITKRTIGTCERDYARALNLMTGQASPSSAVPKQTATQLLAEVVQLLPTESEVTLDRLEVSLDCISLRGTTVSRAAVDDMSTALKTYRCFTQVETGKVETAKGGSRTSFRLDIAVQCPEEEAAPQG